MIDLAMSGNEPGWDYPWDDEAPCPCCGEEWQACCCPCPTVEEERARMGETELKADRAWEGER